MYGLDAAVIETINYQLSLGRVKTDVLSDFLLAPHFSVIYEYAPDELIEHVKTLFKTGKYALNLPIKVDVPKRTGLTRPGAILPPIDRLIYQILTDHISTQAESQLDRTRVFSHILLDDDPEFRMFKPAHESWNNLQDSLKEKCEDNNLCYVVKADITCFFERIYQHNLINLLRASDCDPRIVNLLEKLLLAFTENDSHGILQGMFPSDFLGNFYLASLDSYLAVQDVPFVRYVDDIYLFYRSQKKAKEGLVALCRILRDEGLNLNESKTKIIKTDELIAEETDVDRLFDKAKKEIRDIGTEVFLETPYGFQSIWLTGEEGLSEEKVQLAAIEELYNTDTDEEVDLEKIEKFCLPYLAQTHNDIAVTKSLEGITLKPHLSKIYCSYLMPFARNDINISRKLESILINDDLPYEWSLIWPIAALIDVDSIESRTVTQALRILENRQRLDGLRGLAAYLVAKHGNAGQRRLLKHQYDQEPSSYVKGALLFSSKYFPTNERNSCLSAWGSHSTTNSLIAKAIRAST